MVAGKPTGTGTQPSTPKFPQNGVHNEILSKNNNQQESKNMNTETKQQNGNGALQNRKSSVAHAYANRQACRKDDERTTRTTRGPRISHNHRKRRTLSVHNQCLIAMQYANATIVGGFKQWLKAKRCVMKGQHGAVIWIPMGRKNKETGELEEHTGFVLGSVFDVSQTAEVS